MCQIVSKARCQRLLYVFRKVILKKKETRGETHDQGENPGGTNCPQANPRNKLGALVGGFSEGKYYLRQNKLMPFSYKTGY